MFRAARPCTWGVHPLERHGIAEAGRVVVIRYELWRRSVS
jgi:hypothetical protein